MKSFSITIISLTLVCFYTLAVDQQKKWQNDEELSLEVYHVKKNQLQVDKATNIYFEDDFAMQVTGKEHRYLNIGISYLTPLKKKTKSACISIKAGQVKTSVSGS